MRSGRLGAVGEAYVRSQRFCRGGVGQQKFLVLSAKGASRSGRRDRANFPRVAPCSSEPGPGEALDKYGKFLVKWMSEGVARSGGFSRVRSGRLGAVGEAFVRSQRSCRGGVGQKKLLVLNARGATRSERRDRANFTPLKRHTHPLQHSLSY